MQKFWENAGWLIGAIIIIFFLGVLIGFTIFSPVASSPPRFTPPLSQPEESMPWQKRGGITPIQIHWSNGGHGHHGHHHYSSPHYYPHYYSYYYPAPYYSYPVWPWGYSSPYAPYGECYGCGYGQGYGYEEESRPYFELHRSPNGETQMRWGFQ